MDLQPLRACSLFVIVACSLCALVAFRGTRPVFVASLILVVDNIILAASLRVLLSLPCDETVRLCEFAG